MFINEGAISPSYLHENAIFLGTLGVGIQLGANMPKGLKNGDKVFYAHPFGILTEQQIIDNLNKGSKKKDAFLRKDRTGLPYTSWIKGPQ